DRTYVRDQPKHAVSLPRPALTAHRLTATPSSPRTGRTAACCARHSRSSSSSLRTLDRPACPERREPSLERGPSPEGCSARPVTVPDGARAPLALRGRQSRSPHVLPVPHWAEGRYTRSASMQTADRT